MRIALCDDRAEDLRQLNYLIGARHFTTAFPSGETLLVSLEEFHERYDLYLLDIFMEGISGLELARQIRRLDADALICFISTSEEFYREAYDLYAFQYLIKPVSAQQIQELLERAENRIQLQRQQQIVLEPRGTSVVIPYHKLIFVTSRGHTLQFQCLNKTVYSIREKLSVVAQQLDPQIFFRCHQSYLVNLYLIERMDQDEFVCGEYRIPISRGYLSSARRLYHEVIFRNLK